MFDQEKNPDWRLKVMWSLHQVNGFSENDLIKALDDKDPYVRSWAIQFLCEDSNPPSQALTKFKKMAEG
jgi:hypothetical protein